VALARPLINAVPTGVYQELLIERLATSVRLQADRLRQLLADDDARSAAMRPASSPPAAAASADDYAAFGAASPGRATSAARVGRGGLITQAIQMLLHFPAAAARLETSALLPLAGEGLPGAQMLRELLEFLRGQPAVSTAMVLERWRGRPESRRLAELAHGECLIGTEPAAVRELAEILRALGLLQQEARLNQLVERLASDPSPQEVVEYQQLIRLLRGAARDQA
jgi:DNA primase